MSVLFFLLLCVLLVSFLQVQLSKFLSMPNFTKYTQPTNKVCYHGCRFRGVWGDIAPPPLFRQGGWSMLSSPYFFIQKPNWVEKFQICCISTIQRWTNTYFFWFKIGRKSFNFLKSGYMTVISLSTSVTNTVKDNGQATQAFTIKHSCLIYDTNILLNLF